MWPAWSPVTLASHRTCIRSWLRTHALVRQPWAMGVRAVRCRQWFQRLGFFICPPDVSEETPPKTGALLGALPTLH